MEEGRGRQSLTSSKYRNSDSSEAAAEEAASGSALAAAATVEWAEAPAEGGGGGCGKRWFRFRRSRTEAKRSQWHEVTECT